MDVAKTANANLSVGVVILNPVGGQIRNELIKVSVDVSLKRKKAWAKHLVPVKKDSCPRE